MGWNIVRSPRGAGLLGLPRELLLLTVGLLGCSHPVEEIRPLADPKTKAAVEGTPEILPTAADWPWWRGTGRNNHAQGAAPPTTWTETENVLWKTDIPGRGHASPILWGEQVFLATADDEAKTQSLLALNRKTGEKQWATQLHSGGLPSMHQKNSHASATPACDGERVFAVFANRDKVWVSAVDLQGKVVWQREAGPYQTQWGYGSSPVLFGSLLIVLSDNSNGGFLSALERTTGEIVWRIQRAKDDSYGTPVVGRVSGRDQLLVSGQQHVISYDPLTGAELWRCAGPAQTTADTVTFNDDTVFASGGYPEKNVIAIRGDGSGDVTSTHLLWQAEFKLYVPSPLLVEDRLLAVGDEGIWTCYSAQDGRTLWKQRIGGGFSASPVLVEDLIYVPDERGLTHVFRAGAKSLEKVAQNDLGDGGMASPVIASGQLFLRTAQRLYCIGHPESAAEKAAPVEKSAAVE